MTKTVLLTGSTGKFGSVLLTHLLHSGWRVVATSRSQEALDKLIARQGVHASAVYGVVADIQSSEAIEQLLVDVAATGLKITHLINNARSIATLAVGSDGKTSRDNFLGEFDLDVVVPYELTMALVGSKFHALEAVVNIGSQYGLVAPNPALYEGSLTQSPIQYGVSKAGVHHLTRELAVRLAPQGVRVNCVAFGGVAGRTDEAFQARYADLVPSRRMLDESQIPGPVEFLLSETSSAVSGHVLIADGGWSLW